MTLIYVPAALLSYPREGRSKILAFVRSAFLVAAHPLVRNYHLFLKIDNLKKIMFASEIFNICSYISCSHCIVLFQVLLYLVCLFDTALTFSNKSFFDWIPLSLDATKRGLMYSITDGYIYGNLNYSVACTLLVPCWILLWMVNNARVASK